MSESVCERCVHLHYEKDTNSWFCGFDLPEPEANVDGCKKFKSNMASENDERD